MTMQPHILALAALLFCSEMDWQSTDLAEDRIRSAYVLTASTPVAQTDRVAGQMREIVRRRVHAGLLAAATDMSSRDYLFTPADGMERHVGVFTIRYADATTAHARARAIEQQRFFRHSKIAVAMASAARGTEVLIFYTESAGDPKLVTLLAAMAAGTEVPAGG